MSPVPVVVHRVDVEAILGSVSRLQSVGPGGVCRRRMQEERLQVLGTIGALAAVLNNIMP